MTFLKCNLTQNDFYSAHGVFDSNSKARYKPIDETDGRFFNVRFTANNATVKALYSKLQYENNTFRKPCLTCGTLVKPELQDQHNEAYHPTHH